MIKWNNTQILNWIEKNKKFFIKSQRFSIFDIINEIEENPILKEKMRIPLQLKYLVENFGELLAPDIWDLISQIDWEYFEKENLFSKEDINKLLKLKKIDPEMGIIRIRQFIERIVRYIHDIIFSEITEKEEITLNEMLSNLNEKGTFPEIIWKDINTIRIIGNQIYHGFKSID